jgi:prepilin-type N-terminal cleavage/methylation domain-containing protein
MNTKIKGFSLVEMAIVLVIFGLVLASASSILTLFVNRGGAEKTRQMITSDKSSIVSYVQTNGQLPTVAIPNATPITDFWRNVSYPIDGYNVDFFYFSDPILDKSVWNLAALPAFNVVCGATGTNTLVQICNDLNCSAPTTVNNIAFVIASGSENKNVQTGVTTAAGTNTIRIDFQGTAGVDNYTNTNPNVRPVDFNRQEAYDDIVDWMTLDELRSKVGCDAEAIKFMSQVMPPAKRGADYTYNFYIEGGVPIDAVYGGTHVAEYEWNVFGKPDNDNTLLNSIFNFNVVRNSVPTGINTLSNTVYTQGAFLQVTGNSSSFTQGQYIIEINVRDRANTTYTRKFILNAEQ